MRTRATRHASTALGRASFARETSLARGASARLPGLGSATALGIGATLLGRVAPVIGAPVFAILGGMAIAHIRTPAPSLRPGLAFAGRSVLQGSVVLLGTGLSFREVLSTGSSSLPVLLGSLAVALIGAGLLGRLLSIDGDLRILIGVGTGICGASAIAATDAVIDASDADVSYAITTIFTFNVIAVLTFPTLGRLLSLSPRAFGLWAGTAVNDMSSVVAASSIFGHGAASYAIVVKLTRTLMILPISLVLALYRARHARAADSSASPRSRLARFRRALPIFIAWFLVAVTLNTVGVIPGSWHGTLSALAQVMITIALGAIGLSARLRDIHRTGFRPLALGAMLWALVALSSLGLQLATGRLS